MRTITPEPPTVIVEEILDAGGAGDAGDAGRPDGTPSAETSGRIPFAALILALVAGGMAVLLVLNTATAATEVKQRGIDQANATLYDQEQQLSRDVADLQSPEELAKRAAKLGLIPADAPAFIRINGDGSVTVLGSPAPATTQPPVVTPAPTPTAAAATDPAPPATATQTPTPSPTPSVTPGPSVTPAPTATPSPTQAPTPTVTLPGGPR